MKTQIAVDDVAPPLGGVSPTPELRELPFPSLASRRSRYPVIPVIVLGITYLLVAHLSLGLATVGRSITLVWPSTGLALASLLLFGMRLWPAVAIGALLVNALTPGVPFLSACGMAVGNTLEAVLGVLLLRGAGFKPSLQRVRDVVLLMVLAAGLSTAVSATFGCLSLWLGAVITRAQLAGAWWAWWVGDMMGDLIVAPLLLAAAERVRPRRLPKEALALGAVLCLLSLIAFGDYSFRFHRLIHPYIVFPALIWAALRFDLLGAAAASLLVSSIAVWATVSGTGPFVGGTLNENLLQVQAFMGIAALTALILGAAAGERRRAIRVRDQFLSMASHELKTPLTPMKLQLHLLGRTLDVAPGEGELVQKVRRRLSLLEKQLRRVTKLVDELLDVSRVEVGHLSLDLEELELGSLVREVVEACNEELTAAKCSVEIFTEKDVVGHWDQIRIQQVVTNLLTNATKYAAGSPIRLAVNSDPLLGASISVADGGIGIPGEQQENIFQAFERGSYAPRVGGLGLGLYISRKIVEAHHGSIEVNSEVGQGATFIVRLPLRPPTSPS